ncbi:MAG: hypothetical protein U1D30_10770 [Planctomycetota bacterium]
MCRTPPVGYEGSIRAELGLNIQLYLTILGVCHSRTIQDKILSLEGFLG